ncbi:hypothetical protein [Burkholderia sp. Bp8963]|uniref:hypothetical protein n=1 Tax=Burkholderia sp. Bp8963 TaxID=2184547 RepID=UPI000F593C40|nr:hypothetical protein [Burkholderia sp. Bp8963]
MILRSELRRLGGRSQLTAALGRLVDEGILMRLDRGVFARARKDSGGKAELLAPPEVVVQELFRKLGISAGQVKIERDHGGCVYLIDAGRARTSRQLEVGRDTVRYVGRRHRRRGTAPKMPSNLDKLPKKNVGKFLEAFARAHGIEARRSGLDVWAEAVTRAAGDHVELDPIGQLLITLSKAKLINGLQMARLMTNYIHERRENDALRNSEIASRSSSATTSH